MPRKLSKLLGTFLSRFLGTIRSKKIEPATNDSRILMYNIVLNQFLIKYCTLLNSDITSVLIHTLGGVSKRIVERLVGRVLI